MLAQPAHRGPSWGRFRLLETVGGDACGRVLRVTDAETGVARALGIVPPEHDRPLQLDELDQLARLRHPGLPRVFETGRSTAALEPVPAGSLFVLAEWISGARSDQLAWPARDAAPRVAALLGEVAAALAALHAAGLVHGDVAPHNVIIDSAGRAILVDLAPRTVSRGTAGYAAPEALAGAPEPRSDLYALGATAVRLVTGRALDDAGELPAALAALPDGLVRLICRLVARCPDARPASAVAVLDELGLPAGEVAGGRRRTRCGAALGPTAWPGAAEAIDGLARSLAARAPLIAVIGVAASGARALVDAALRRQRLAVSSGWRAAPLAGTFDELAAALGVRTTGYGARAAAWLERVARAARRADAPVVLELADDPRAGAVLRALARAQGVNPVLAIVDRDPGDTSADQPQAVVRHVAPLLACEDVAALVAAALGSAPPRAWAHALHVASAGLPVLVLDLLRSIAGEPQPFAVDWTARTSAGFVELRARQLRAAPAGARRVATAIAAWGGRVSIARTLATLRASRAAAMLADVAELERLGLGQRCGDELTIDRATAEAAELVTGSDALVRLAAVALAMPWPHADEPTAARSGDAARGMLRFAGAARTGRGRADELAHAVLPSSDADRGDDELAGDTACVVMLSPVMGGELRIGSGRTEATGAAGQRSPGARADDQTGRLLALAPLLERATLDAGRVALACDVAELLEARGLAARALELARRGLALAPARAGMIAARAALALGAHRDAAAHAAAAARAGAEPLEATSLGAHALARAGELDAAEAALAALHAAYPTDPRAVGRYALLLARRGCAREARAIATAASPLAGSAAEAAGRAALALGELAGADAAFAAFAAAAEDGVTRARAAVLRGRLAVRRGQLGLACDHLRAAANELVELGERAGAAIAELELGNVLVARGRASEALPPLGSAARTLAELASDPAAVEDPLGDAGEPEAGVAWDDAELARGAALLMVGQLEDARTAAEAVLARGLPAARAAALVLAGEALHRLGDAPAALGAYREAAHRAAACGDAAAELSARLALEAAGDGDGAVLAGLCATADDRDLATLARGRRALVDPSWRAELAWPNDPDAEGSLRAATLAAARACAAVAVRATDADRLERAFRSHALAAQLAHRGRHAALARAEAARARIAHAAMAAVTAPAFRAALDGHPDLARLPGPEAGPLAPRDAPDAAALRTLLAVSRRLLGEPSAERICGEVLDAAIELTCAERGVMFLRTPGGALVSAAMRGCDADELDAGVAGPRAIAERAAAAAEPAGLDGAARITGASSVRSALAVPLGPRGATIGSLYVDHRRVDDAFDSTASSVLGELAALATAAIAAASRTAELARAADDADQHSAQLAARLAELARTDDAAQPAPGPSSALGDDLRLRPVLAATERAYLAAAMVRSNGNQSAAARLLGLSRFGLQKKLRRLADTDERD